MSTCKQAPGLFVPVIDINRCEGKGPCITACPLDVLEMHTLPLAQRQSMSLVGRLKGWAHGWQQASAVRPGLCEACGLCVAACPEQAIRLVRTPNASAGS